MESVPIKTAIYTRVSTEDQAKEGFSLDAQLDKLKSYCKAKDWEVSDIYIDDGYSGRNIKRPEYKRMMNEKDKWDVLLVIKMDRIHRNSKNFMMMMEDLKREDKGFVSMTESLDTSTAMGRFVVDIIQRIAQLESEQIGERVYIGMEQKARTNGGILGFNIPFGYDYINGKLVINKKEAKHVNKIFNLYLNDFSMKKIAETLNHKDVQTKRRKKWGSQTISTILKNPLYCGYIRWENHINKSNHDLIVTIDLFNKVQQKIKNKSKLKNPKVISLKSVKSK
jgi:DNA invertase Pin-like site-specific DNA recombinase